MNDRRPPVAEKNEDDQDDQQDRRANRDNHVADGFADRVRGIEGDLVCHAGRKTFGKTVQFGDALSMHVEGVGGGELRDGDAHRVVSVVVEVGAVILGAEFGVTDIPEANERAVGIALEDDVVELRRFRQAADGADADLKLLAGRSGLRTDLSSGDLDVLLGESIDHIVGGEGAPCQAHGIEPQAHGVFALAEDDDIGDAGNALQAVADVNIEVVADEERGADYRRAINSASAKDEVLRGLGDGDTDLLRPRRADLQRRCRRGSRCQRSRGRDRG